MQQRRVRLGDILDDYCPRERRITNHAVVAMVDEEVKQTRCTTCDADHEYKQARIPPQRRKRAAGMVESPEAAALRRPEMSEAVPPEEAPAVDAQAAEPFEPPPPQAETAEPEEAPIAAAADEDGPVHRRLIRATLPRPDGQSPERKEPDFTIRQPGVRGGRPFTGHKNGHRHGHRQMRAHGGSQPPRFGSGQPPRHGSGHAPRHGSGQAPRHGSGSGPGHRPAGNRMGHPGGPRGHVPGGSRGGRKRGR